MRTRLMRLGQMFLALVLLVGMLLVAPARVMAAPVSRGSAVTGRHEGQAPRLSLLAAGATLAAAAAVVGVEATAVKPERTRCKFRCEAVKPGFGEQIQVQLRAQYEQDNPVPEDERFSRYTPCGTFDATIDNPALNGFFEPGKSYYLDITPAE